MKSIKANITQEKKQPNYGDIFSTLDMIQESLFDSKKTSTNDDILKLMFSKKYVFGISRKKISVVKRAYGTNKLAIKVLKGKFNDKDKKIVLSSDVEEILRAVIDGSIHENINNKNVLFQKNEAKNQGFDVSLEEPFYRNNDYKLDSTCQLTGNYSKILIVPMRLYQDKSIGVFIIGGMAEDSNFEESFSRDIDSLSNRVALFMSESDNRHRRKIQYALNFALNQKESPSRRDIVKCCVQHFTLDLHAHYEKWVEKEKIRTDESMLNRRGISEIKNISQNLFPISTQPWFARDELDIIVRSPHYFDRFFWVYGQGEVKVSDGREGQGQKIDLKKLQSLAGSQLGNSGYGYDMPESLIQVFNNKRPLILNSSKECEKYFQSEEKKKKGITLPKSCAIFPMKIPGGGVIGYFIFKNFIENRAYKEEEVLLDDISNRVADLFVKIRFQEREEKLTKFREIFNKNNRSQKSYEFYIDKFSQVLKNVYGEDLKYCLIIRNKQTSDIPEFNSDSSDMEVSNSFLRNINDECSKQEVLSLARDFIMSRNNETACYVRDFLDSRPNPSSLEESQKGDEKIDKVLKRSAIFPLHRLPDMALGFPIEESPEDSKEKINVGCLIIKDAHLGLSDLRFLDSLTDQLAFKFKLLDDQERKVQTYAFSKEIRESDDINIGSLLELIRKYTKKIMYTSNMFIALLDYENTNKLGFPSIKFPLFYENGKLQPDIQKKVEKNRFFDPESNEKGRVEAILATGETIYIDNLENSQAWYDHPNHEERAGNYYASFIGTPIWQKRKVVGVVAAYHPDKEFAYEEADLNFLIDIADKASGLLRDLQNTELKEAIKELKSANKLIAESERKARDSDYIKDINHQMGNILPSIRNNLSEISHQIEYSILNSTTADNYLANDQINKIIDLLDEKIPQIKNAHLISHEKHEVYLPELLEEVYEEQLITYDLYEMFKAVEVNAFHKGQLSIEVVRLDIYICLSNVIENACQSIKKLIDNNKMSKDDAILDISILADKEMINISIKDNGSEIPEEILKNLFKFGVSEKISDGGYGLWRTKHILNSMGSEIKIVKSSPVKEFRLSIPIQKQPLNALILEDEPLWRNSVKKYLEDEFINIFEANSFDSGCEFLTRNTKPSLFFVDISLDSQKSNNMDGLRFINKIRETVDDAKIVLVSAYTEKSKNYSKKIDLLIKKTDGCFKNKELFVEKLKSNGII